MPGAERIRAAAEATNRPCGRAPEASRAGSRRRCRAEQAHTPHDSPARSGRRRAPRGPTSAASRVPPRRSRARAARARRRIDPAGQRRRRRYGDGAAAGGIHPAVGARRARAVTRPPTEIGAAAWRAARSTAITRLPTPRRSPRAVGRDGRRARPPPSATRATPAVRHVRERRGAIAARDRNHAGMGGRRRRARAGAAAATTVASLTCNPTRRRRLRVSGEDAVRALQPVRVVTADDVICLAAERDQPVQRGEVAVASSKTSGTRRSSRVR